MNEPRQTLGYLRELLELRNIRPKNKLGQNFLIDQNLLDLVVRAAELTRADLVLEVGSGTGTLTTRLAALAGHVLAVEIDPAFAVLTRELTDGMDHVSLFEGDVLRNKNELNPQLLAQLDALMETARPERLKLVANLPYVVATPVICNLLLGTRPLERMIVMVQWEIAERLMAKPSDSMYSSLAVLVQSLADVSLVRRLGPQVFWPPPKVDSAIVDIRPSGTKRAEVGDVVAFRAFLRDLYTHRRKNLRGALVGWPSGRRAKAEVDARLAALGIPGEIRAEELDLKQHQRLCAAFADIAAE